MLLLMQDRDRIAGGMTDLVVHRLFSSHVQPSLQGICSHPVASARGEPTLQR